MKRFFRNKMRSNLVMLKNFCEEGERKGIGLGVVVSIVFQVSTE